KISVLIRWHRCGTWLRQRLQPGLLEVNIGTGRADGLWQRGYRNVDPVRRQVGQGGLRNRTDAVAQAQQRETGRQQLERLIERDRNRFALVEMEGAQVMGERVDRL